jgi:hypothetical protein
MATRLNPWRALAALNLALVELSWLVLWYRGLIPAAARLPLAQVFATLGGLLLLATSAGRFLPALRLRSGPQFVVVGALLGLSLLFGLRYLLPAGAPGLPRAGPWWDLVEALPAEFIVTAVVLFAWWRGLRLARLWIGPAAVLRVFKWGAGLLLAHALLFTHQAGPEQAGWAYGLFTFAGLMALAASRVALLASLRGGRRSPFDRRWLGGLAGAALVTVSVSALVAAGLYSQRERLAGWLEGLLYFLGLLVAAPVLLLATLLAGSVDQLQAALPTSTPAAPIPTWEVEAASPKVAERLAQLLRGSGGISISELLFYAALLAAILLLLLGVRQAWTAAARLRSERVDSVEAYAGLAGLARSLAEALLDGARQAGAELARRWRRGGQLLASARIRRIYARLLALGADLDQPRPAAHTPLEYLLALEALFPEHTTELELITAAYVQVRYGELPENPAQMAAIERAWERLQARGAALLQARRLQASQAHSR